MHEANALRARAEKAEAALAAKREDNPASPTATTKLKKGTPVKSETGKRLLKSPWAEGQAGRNARALQGKKHGRRAVRARGVSGDVRDVSLSRA